MQDRAPFAATAALNSASPARALGGMIMMTIITTTTHMRGASG